VVASPAAVTGAPTADELVERYALSTGFDLDRLAWYVAFAWFKLGVILAGVAARDEASQTDGQRFHGVRELIEPCIERGLTSLGGDRQ
jgi:aminoglycoside phosphotransferase (APT) family kinase protein